VNRAFQAMRALTKLTVEVPLALNRALDYVAPSEWNVALNAVVEVTVGTRAYVALVTAVAPIAEADASMYKGVRRVICAQLPQELVSLAEFVALYYQVPLGMACGLITPNEVAPPPEPIAWRLTPLGAKAVTLITQRQTAQRELAAMLREGMSVEARQALSAAQRKTLKTWIDAAHVEPVFTQSQNPLILAQLPPPTAEQANAISALRETRAGFSVTLLLGVTGSGKTEVYLDAIAATISAGKQALLLVPEINLTPQLVQRIEAALPGVRTAVLHSKLTPNERNRAWHDVHSARAQLVVGTRLAVFAPITQLGRVVIDEEHDASYKQNESPRYHARDVAIIRAKALNVPVILASATPSLESWRQARAGRYRLLRLKERATAAAQPRIRLVPAKGRHVKLGLSQLLADGISDRLKRNEQSLVLVNRRGFAPSLYCPHCAWSAPCKRCDAKLTLHQFSRSLRCHHCGYHAGVPAKCPSCGHPDLIGSGVGTQKLEQALRESFPEARIARADTDALSGKYAWRRLFEQILAREIDIVVGTQMLAKGHDFPALTLVGVVDSDRAIFSTDFRAQEDLFALLTQVAGRAGRHALPGEVVIQTEFPNHPTYQAIVKGDYDEFADATLASRDAFGLPPLTRMALIRGEAKDANAVADFFARAHATLRNALAENEGEVFPPQPAPLARKADFTRWTMQAIAPKVAPLANALATLRESIEATKTKVRWTIDVDPYDFG
jgi:primosomal protein N' (replication factor Y) (superfamily II helicase)